MSMQEFPEIGLLRAFVVIVVTYMIQSYKDVREIVLVHCVAVKIIGITGVWTLTEMFSLASRW